MKVLSKYLKKILSDQAFPIKSFGSIRLYQLFNQTFLKVGLSTNPPYGVRVSSNRDLRNLYAQFGNVLRKYFSGWRVVFLCSDVALAAQTKLDIRTLLSISNGGIQVVAYFAEI